MGTKKRDAKGVNKGLKAEDSTVVKSKSKGLYVALGLGLVSAVGLGVVGVLNVNKNKVEYTDVQEPSFEENNLANQGDVIEAPEPEKVDVIAPVYEGNYYQNDFLGLKFRYPENWFTTDNYDTLLNTMKELNINDMLDITTMKLPRWLHVADFNSEDNYRNIISVSLLPDFSSLVTSDIDIGTLKPATTSETPVVEKQEEVKTKSKLDTHSFDPSMYIAIEDAVVENQKLSGLEAELVEGTYVETIGGCEVLTVETVNRLYADAYNVLTSFVDLGENYLMFVSTSLDQPNDVDKLLNLEDILATLEISGVKLSVIQGQEQDITDKDTLKPDLSETKAN